MSGVRIAFPGSLSRNRLSLPMSALFLTRVDYHSYSLASRRGGRGGLNTGEGHRLSTGGRGRINTGGGHRLSTGGGGRAQYWFGLHTIFAASILYGVWHTQGNPRGADILPNIHAIVMQQCGQCRRAGGIKRRLIRAPTTRSKRISCKGQIEAHTV